MIEVVHEKMIVQKSSLVKNLELHWMDLMTGVETRPFLKTQLRRMAVECFGIVVSSKIIVLFKVDSIKINADNF